MARDDKTIMRGTLATAGGLLAFYSALAMIYAETLRSRSDFCADASFIVINGVCYTVWKLLLPVFLLGLILLIVGLVVFRAQPDELEGHLHHGTGAHFTMALLVSLVVLPALLWVVQTVRQGDGEAFVIEFSGVEFEHVFLLQLATLVGLIAFVPFLGLYISIHGRRRRFLRAVEQATEESDEEALPHEEGYTYEDAEAADLEGEMPEEDWPEEREEGWEEEAPMEAAAEEPYAAEAAPEGEVAWSAEEEAPAEEPVEETDEAAWPPAEQEEQTSWDQGEEEATWADAEETAWPDHDAEEPSEEAPSAWGQERDAEEKPSWMQPSDADTSEDFPSAEEQRAEAEPAAEAPEDEPMAEASGREAEPEPEPEPEPEEEPEPEDEPEDAPIIGCMHKDADGTSCPNPVRSGSRFCEAHACQGLTRAGKPCGNAAVGRSKYCQVHKK